MPRLAPYAIILVLLILLGWTGKAYLDMRDQLVDYKATIATMGRVAQKAADDKEAEGNENLKKVKAENEALIPQIAANAITNYLRAHPVKLRKPAACPSALPQNGTGQQVDDGAQQEPIPDGTSGSVADPANGAEIGTLIEVEPGTIRECALDAAKVRAFQLYCVLNRCPVE